MAKGGVGVKILKKSFMNCPTTIFCVGLPVLLCLHLKYCKNTRFPFVDLAQNQILLFVVFLVQNCARAICYCQLIIWHIIFDRVSIYLIFQRSYLPLLQFYSKIVWCNKSIIVITIKIILASNQFSIIVVGNWIVYTSLRERGQRHPLKRGFFPLGLWGYI